MRTSKQTQNNTQHTRGESRDVCIPLQRKYIYGYMVLWLRVCVYMYYYAMGTNNAARVYAIWSASRMKRHYSGERPDSTAQPPCEARA